MAEARSLDRQSAEEPIPSWFCACSSYPDDPGMVVCWKCEQPLVFVDPDGPATDALIHNLLGVLNRYHETLARISEWWLGDHPQAGDRPDVRAIAAMYGVESSEAPSILRKRHQKEPA